MTDIPKTIQVHLNEIAERLNQGKATVMVGAGFSKNAVKIKNTDKKFLSWNELADLFYEKLNGEKPDEKTEKEKDETKKKEQLNNLYKLWKDSMQCYPGWIIMPYKFRCKFVNSIGDFECYLRAYHDTVAQNDNAIFLDFLKVYDWIRQVCLFADYKKNVLFI